MNATITFEDKKLVLKDIPHKLVEELILKYRISKNSRSSLRFASELKTK